MSRNDIDNYLKIFIHSLLPLFFCCSLLAVASVLISLSFLTRLCSALCHLVISSFHPIVETRRAIKFMQLFSCFVLLVVVFSFHIRRTVEFRSWAVVADTHFLPVLLCRFGYIVRGIWRIQMTPLTFHLELRPGQVTEKILRFFMTSFRSLSMCAESKVLRCSTKW